MIIRTEGRALVDEHGHERSFRGINLVSKDPNDGYIPQVDEAFFARLQADGFNLIRFGLQWDGVEPEPGLYNDSYLALLKQQIRWAEAHDIAVILDMHQDLYGIRYSDGAPEWATLDGGHPHITGDLWSDAYLLSPAVQHAFDAFWSNAVPPDSDRGLQDHYRAMWEHVARFFADCSNVIGYDVLNEPYPGSQGQETFGAIAEAALQSGALTLTEDTEIASLWANDSSKAELLANLTDLELYDALAKHAAPSSQRFEREVLMPYYETMHAAIAPFCPHWLVFQEASYFTNMGIRSAITPVSEQSVYAPHGYDLVVDTDHYEAYSTERVDYIFHSHYRTQHAHNLPTLIGEWGAFSDHPRTPELVRHLLSRFEANGWSHAYWCWYEGIEDAAYWPALVRSYPTHVAGRIRHLEGDPQAFRLELDAVEGESIIYHPELAAIDGSTLTLTLTVNGRILDNPETRRSPIRNTGAGHLAIRHPGGRIFIEIR